MSVDGLHIRCQGPADAPAVVFSAGLGGGGGYWSVQEEYLCRDHRVVTYDHRGTGRSDRSALPSPYRVEHMAHDIGLVLDALHLRQAHLVGHAAGGLAALAFARGAAARVTSLAVVNGWAAMPAHTARCFAIRRDIYVAGGADAYLRAQPMFLYPAGWIDRHLDALDADRREHVASFQTRDALFARMTALEAFDMRADLPDIDVPSLIVVADDDMLVPPAASDALVTNLPRATRGRIPWGGHAINITAPDAFNQTLRRFLADPRGATAR